MIRLIACIVLSFCACSIAVPRAEAGVLGFAWRVVTAPVRAAKQVRVNQLEARAHRGNKVASARLENTHARMHARNFHH